VIARRIARAGLALSTLVGPGACVGPNVKPLKGIDRQAFDPNARGTLFIVGGGPRPPQMMQQFIELAGGRGKARILVFPMATADTGTGPALAAEMRRLGAVSAWSVPATRAQADSASGSVVAAVDSATGIWFAGGDQNRIMRAIGGTPVERAIKRRYQGGAVVGGTSAGAAVMSATMLTGDERRPGGARPLAQDSRDAFVTIDRANVVTTPGLGLLPGAIVDQHFLRRRRHNRLMSLVLERPERFGVGVDESTVLVIEPSGRWRVIGESSVVVYDGRLAYVTKQGPLGGTGVAVHVLPAGSTYDPRTNAVTFPTP
jgi:cyanophycinase